MPATRKARGKGKFRPGHPGSQAREYRHKISPYLADMKRLTALNLRALAIKTDASSDLPPEFEDALKEAQATLDDLWSPERLAQIVEPTFDKVDRFNQANTPKALKTIKLDPDTRAKLKDEFVKDNVELIQSIPERFHESLTDELSQAIADGSRWEDISETIQDRYGVSESQADLIARDQCSKANSNLSAERYQSAGVSEFIWSTSGDERVRDEHQALDGKTLSYPDGDPTEGLPGEPINCRCWQTPIIPGLD